MANPQTEHGYTKVANETLEKLIAVGLDGTELAVVLFVFRKTYGYKKKEDAISISQFEKILPVSRKSIITALKRFQAVKIITLVKKSTPGKNKGNIYKFNKNHDEWKLVKKITRVKSSAGSSEVFFQKVVKKTTHTKENNKRKYTKENKAREIDLELTDLLIEGIGRNNPAFEQKYIRGSPAGQKELQSKKISWAEDIEKLWRIDNATEDQIRFVIHWVFGGKINDKQMEANNFWKSVVLSGANLRKNFTKIVGQIKRDICAKNKTYDQLTV